MSDRYTDRETTLVDYLTTALGSTYWVSRAPSFANYPPGKVAVGVRWTGMDNDLDRGTSDPAADSNSFSLRIVPNVVIDSDADTAINLAVDDICSALRTVSSYSVFGDNDFQPCGWRIIRAQKGYVEKVGLVADVTLLALIEEQYTGRLASITEIGLDLGSMCTSWKLTTPPRVNPIMTSNTAPSGVASASSVIAAGYEAWKAMDNVIATGAGDWVATAGVFPSWLQYQFTSAQTVKGYRITTRNEVNFPLVPKSWTFAGSNDGTNWTTLDTQTNITDWANARNTTKTFYIGGNTTAYTYYRLTITAGNQNYAAVGELEILTELPVSCSPTRSVILHNDGTGTLTIDSITVPSWLTASGEPATVAAGGTETFTVTVNTDDAGIYSGEIVIIGSDRTVTMPVTASVVAP